MLMARQWQTAQLYYRILRATSIWISRLQIIWLGHSRPSVLLWVVNCQILDATFCSNPPIINSLSRHWQLARLLFHSNWQPILLLNLSPTGLRIRLQNSLTSQIPTIILIQTLISRCSSLFSIRPILQSLIITTLFQVIEPKRWLASTNSLALPLEPNYLTLYLAFKLKSTLSSPCWLLLNMPKIMITMTLFLTQTGTHDFSNSMQQAWRMS